MVTKKEINFSTYCQTFEFIDLDVFSRMLVNIFRLSKINTTAYKLDFFERMLNFMRIIALEALSNNMPTDQTGKITDEWSDLHGKNKMDRSFIEFLFHFGILKFNRNRLIINDRYKRFIEEGIVKRVVHHEDTALLHSLSKRERKVVNDFLFIKDLVKKYNNSEYVFRHVDDNKHFWESLINEKKLDYEVRLCETLYNLIDLKISQKIKSPFDEDYYTESGQNAFKNFTRFVFLDYLKKISQHTKMQVFDLGCGYGNYIEAIHSVFPNSSITGIEINPKVFSATKKKFEEAEHIEILNENFFDHTADKKYDIILMNYVLFYFNSSGKKRLIEKAKNMLSDNGSMIICQYFSGIENLKKKIAQKQKAYSLSKKIEMYYSDKILYANTLWNDAVDTFSEAVKWDEFQTIISESELHIESMVNADKFYYSFFIELKKN